MVPWSSLRQRPCLRERFQALLKRFALFVARAADLTEDDLRPNYPIRVGVPGVEYFCARRYSLPPGKDVYLDGQNVRDWAFESDLKGGWVKGYARKAGIDPPGPGRDRVIVKYGKVELR